MSVIENVYGMHFALVKQQWNRQMLKPSDFYMKHPHWCNFIIHLNLTGPVQFSSETGICVKKFIKIHLYIQPAVRWVLGLFYGGKADE
jgi:hypothetical protein